MVVNVPTGQNSNFNIAPMGPQSQTVPLINPSVSATGGIPAFGGATGSTGSGLTRTEQIKQFTNETQSADYTTVQYVANQVYQNLMGRNARPDEISSLYTSFNEYAKTHPIFTRTAQYQLGGTGPSMFTSGYQPVKDIQAQRNALTVSDFINAMVQNNPESEAFGAAKTYMQAMRNYLDQYRSSI